MIGSNVRSYIMNGRIWLREWWWVSLERSFEYCRLSLQSRLLRVLALRLVKGSRIFGQLAKVYSRGKRRHRNGSKEAQIFV